MQGCDRLRFVSGGARDDAEHQQRDRGRGTTVGHQRQLQAGHRKQPDDVADVDHGLTEHPARGTCGQQTQERIHRTHGDAQAGVDEEAEQTDDRQAADHPEFLADDGEDEVVVRVGEVTPLRAALSEPATEQSAVGQRVFRLGGLIRQALGVLTRIQPCLDAIGAVTGGEREHGCQRQTGHQHRTEQPSVEACEPQQSHQDDAEGDGGTEVRLQHDEQTHQQSRGQQRHQQ